MEKTDPFWTVGRTVNGCTHYENGMEVPQKKLKLELPYDPAIPLRGIYLNKFKTLV